MPINIGSNLAALQAQRRLGESTTSLRDTFERLSSGLRINRAKDDAAGLSISESLKVDSRVFVQGVRNLNDGLSLLSIADSSMENLSNIVIRIRELAEQASNGVNGAAQRKAIDSEAQSLAKEFSRIVQTTEFNGRKVLTSDLGSLVVQGGYGTNGRIVSTLGGNVGTGNFGTSTNYATESTSSAGLYVADFNRDGIQDLVSAGTDGSAGYATVFLGRGDGSFGTGTSYLMEGTTSTDVTAGDLNGDGNLDLVTVGTGGATGRATVRLGIGDGTFQAAVSYTTTTGSLDVTLADMNNDGFLDLIAGGFNGFATRLGSGDGTFGNAVIVNTSTTNGVAVADLNEDGKQDVVAATNALGTVAVVLGRGDGTYAASDSSNKETGSILQAVALGDVNGDGHVDIVTAGSNAGGRVYVRLGYGDGTFQSSTSYAAEAGSSNAVALGDLNGDGILDIITSGSDGYSTVRLGNGNGTFGAATSFSMQTTSSSAVGVGDLDGDGVYDLLSAGTSTGGSAAVRLGSTTSGTGAILSFSLLTRGDALQSMAVLDRKLNQLSVQRGTIGAFQSRLISGINSLQVGSENYQTASSRITDADVAEEAANLVRGKILQQAAGAVLAQAKVQPAIALTLLKKIS